MPEKAIAFADVIKYIKTVGEEDWQRKYNCYQDPNGVASGGMNRKKCISVFLPEERVGYETYNTPGKKRFKVENRKNNPSPLGVKIWGRVNLPCFNRI